MKDFIIFANVNQGNTLVRKSEIISVCEHNYKYDNDVIILTNNGYKFKTTESFDSIISKLGK